MQGIEGATITIMEGNPITQTRSGAEGSYTAWLSAGNYTLNIAAAGQLSYTSTVSIVAGETANVDLRFRPERPCLVYTPPALEAWVITGTLTYTLPGGLELTNNGGEQLTFEFIERDKPPQGLVLDEVPWLWVSPDKGTLPGGYVGDTSENVAIFFTSLDEEGEP